MTRKEMGENLKASSKTVIKVFKELEEAKLIKQENQGKGKAYKIYVVDVYSKDMEKLHKGNVKSTNKVVDFLPSNNINKKYNYKSDRDYSNFDWMSLYANNFK